MYCMAVDGKEVLRKIRLRLDGKVTDEEWADFQESLEENRGPGCPKCSDTGLVHIQEGGDTVYRCPCPAGMVSQPMFAASDKKRERPIEIKRLLPKKEVKPLYWD